MPAPARRRGTPPDGGRGSRVVASGVTPRSALGAIPPDSHVSSYLPQPEVLRSCDLAICHGGNNTVTEALWAGVALLVCPFSTDQFAGAEDVRRAGLGDVFGPNAAAPEEIADRALRVLTGLELRECQMSER
jgi:UDP:flavonoid glycosyltransferase YjiC (YdhE family)